MIRRRSLKPTEYDEQKALFDWAYLRKGQIPELELLMHIPNGGYRNRVEAARFKAIGVKPGVPDLLLACARGGRHGLFIELKTLQGRVSTLQYCWIRVLMGQGYAASICFGADSAIKTIEQYLRGEWVY